MKTTAQVRGVDKHLWDMFILKCKKDLGKEWGHLPTENDPITSAPAYVISRLIELYIKEQVCVFADDGSTKRKIIEASVKQLVRHQAENGPFDSNMIAQSLMDHSLLYGMHPSQRTLEDYTIPITNGLCRKVGPKFPKTQFYVVDLDRLRSVHANTHAYTELEDIMFG